MKQEGCPTNAINLDHDCVKCGGDASWSSQHHLSAEQVDEWWKNRLRAAQDHDYPPKSVLCTSCEAYLNSKLDDVDEEGINKPETVKDDTYKREKMKKLILIRHAESINNVDKREAKIAFDNIISFTNVPTYDQVSYQYLPLVVCGLS